MIEAQPGKTLLDYGDFEQLYAMSIKSPDVFWGTLAKQFLQWEKPFTTVMADCDMEKGVIKWFTGGKLNVSGIIIANCNVYLKYYSCNISIIYLTTEYTIKLLATTHWHAVAWW